MIDRRSHEPYYVEVYRFRQPLLWVIIVSFLVLIGCIFIGQVLLGYRLLLQPAAESKIILLTIIGIAAAAIISIFRLTIVVTDDSVLIKMFPFYVRRIPVQEIKHYFVMDENDRIGAAQSTVYSMVGNYGVKLELQNGRTVVIGSDKARELYHHIDKRIKAHPVLHKKTIEERGAMT